MFSLLLISLISPLPLLGILQSSMEIFASFRNICHAIFKRLAKMKIFSPIFTLCLQ
jgi:hypothetical protein